MAVIMPANSCVDSCVSICYAMRNRAATPLAARLSAFWAAIYFYRAVLEFASFVCYTINNKPATPPNLRVSAHFRQAFSFQFKKAIEVSQIVCYNILKSTRRASDRKVKQAGFLFAGGL